MVATELEAENDRLRAEVESLRRALDKQRNVEKELRADNALFRQIIDSLPVGVSVTDAKGQFTLFGRTLQEIVGAGATTAGPEGWAESYKPLMPDTGEPMPPENFPLVRALRGESVNGAEAMMRPPTAPDGVWVSADARPLTDESGAITGAVAVTRNITEQKRLSEALSARNAALEQSEAEKASLITRLRLALRELSAPILEVWDDVLALPIIGVVDSQRSAEMTARLLDAVSQSQVKFVILDLTGVDTIDTGTANNFIKLGKAVELLGAECVLTGIRPVVAQALVSLDTDFGELMTLHNLKHGLRECMRLLAKNDAPAREPAGARRFL